MIYKNKITEKLHDYIDNNRLLYIDSLIEKLENDLNNNILFIKNEEVIKEPNSYEQYIYVNILAYILLYNQFYMDDVQQLSRLINMLYNKNIKNKKVKYIVIDIDKSIYYYFTNNEYSFSNNFLNRLSLFYKDIFNNRAIFNNLKDSYIKHNIFKHNRYNVDINNQILHYIIYNKIDIEDIFYNKNIRVYELINILVEIIKNGATSKDFFSYKLYFKEIEYLLNKNLIEEINDKLFLSKNVIESYIKDNIKRDKDVFELIKFLKNSSVNKKYYSNINIQK